MGQGVRAIEEMGQGDRRRVGRIGETGKSGKTRDQKVRSEINLSTRVVGVMDSTKWRHQGHGEGSEKRVQSLATWGVRHLNRILGCQKSSEVFFCLFVCFHAKMHHDFYDNPI